MLNENEQSKVKESKVKENKINNKIHYSEFVSMTNDEYQKLINQYGLEDTNKMIEILNNYKGSSGKKYKSDYLAILSWVTERLSQKPKQQHQQSTNKAFNIDDFLFNKED